MLISRWWPLFLAACIDEPVRITPPGGGPPADRLSELGLFAELANQVPAAGVVPYDVIAPLWSDGASKHRFILAPAPLATTADRWTFSDGTYLVKTFYFGDRLVETRVIAFTGGGTQLGTYLWNAAQTDAFATGGNLDIAVGGIEDHVPGTSQCDSCHRGGALGVRSPELADQLPALVAAGVADRVPDGIVSFVDPYGDAPLADRAAAYLEINCAHCHSPGGEASGTHADWRRDQLATDICRDANDSVDGADRVIDPGHPESSVMIKRMRATDPFIHMPRGPSHILDDRGVALLEAWISSLTGCP